MSVFRPLCLSLCLCAATSVSAAEQVSARYDILIAGMKVGAAALNGAFTPSAYEASVTVRLQGMAKLVTSGVGSATASGSFGTTMAQPAAYSLNLKMPDKSEKVQMNLSGNVVRALSAEPDKPPLPDQIPLTNSHQAGVIDPLSGGLFLSRDDAAAMGPDACAKTMPVFDGRQRYDLSFGFERKDSLKTAGYSGPALVCNARYRPIAGHSPAQTHFMATNREMEVWLVPVAGSKVFLPGRIKIRTPVGMAIIEPTRLNLGEMTGSIKE